MREEEVTCSNPTGYVAHDSTQKIARLAGQKMQVASQ